MSQATLSRDLALCIGLAAKALPDTQPKVLTQALTDKLGLPITQAKLSSLTLAQYQQLFQHAYPQNDLKQSLQILKQGAKAIHKPTSEIQLYRKGDMPHSIRIAIVSDDGVHINGQFSACKEFYIFQVSAEEYRLIAVRAAETSEPLKAEQKQFYRAEILQDCQVLYSQSIGGPAAAKVIKMGVHPIKLSNTALISDIIEQLQHVLMTSPPPWIAKSMGVEPQHPTRSLQEDSL